MSQSSDAFAQQSQTGGFARFLNAVERLGNLLPHPVTLFAILSIFIVLLSGVLGYFDIAVADPRPEGADGREADGMIEVISLVNAEGLARIVTGLVTNFTGFAPLGTVLVALLGVSVAEHSGLLSTILRSMVVGKFVARHAGSVIGGDHHTRCANDRPQLRGRGGSKLLFYVCQHVCRGCHGLCRDGVCGRTALG
jgi:p-aminobenzoyl-glutamate transporter AbgT